MSERVILHNIDENHHLFSEVSIVRSMSDQWPVPLIKGLRLVGEKIGIHWSVGETILKGLIRAQVINPENIPFRGQKEQRGLTPEQVVLLSAALSFSKSNNLFVTRRRNRFDQIITHLEQAGFVTKAIS